MTESFVLFYSCPLMGDS